MSNILEAMRKTSESRDGIFRLEALDDVHLFPQPEPRLQAELEQLAARLIGRPGEGVADAGQVYTFASTVSGEGTSFISYHVAQCLSRLLERRVAWVDGNFNSPQLRLEGRGLDFRSLLLDPSVLATLHPRGLTLVGNGTRQAKIADLLSAGPYLDLLEQFRRQFAFTIIDAPPVLQSTEVGHLASPTQGLILVVQSRRLKHEIIRHGIEKLKSHGIPLIGTVLNMRTFEIPEPIYRRI